MAPDTLPAYCSPYKKIATPLPGHPDVCYYDIYQLGKKEEIDALPVAIRIFLENAARNCNGVTVTKEDVDAILNWGNVQKEINYCPARVLLQDFTGVPAVVDLAAMRDSVKKLGGDPNKINPLIPTQLVIDHSVVVDVAGTEEALQENMKLEFERNRERFGFLKWGATAFKNMQVVPPGKGICHQVNLEYLASCAFYNDEKKEIYPDTVVGTDSHTTMISGLGVLGWGVGGIEAEAVMLGQPYSMQLPEVIGFILNGTMSPLCTATDLVLTITNILRAKGVVGKIVEFVGAGSLSLSVADRATVANMAPEYGATTGFFPVDVNAIQFLKMTGRDPKAVSRVEKYWETCKIANVDPSLVKYTDTVTLDLNTVVPCVSGPKRPHDLVPCSDLKKLFLKGLTDPVSFSAFGISPSLVDKKVSFNLKSKNVDITLTHGSVVLAAITSCTNTSNPSVMLGAGLLARNAAAKGLTVAPYVKTSLSPGSAVVMKYFEKSKLDKELEKLGFFCTGFGCMTCIGNSGDLDPQISSAITDNNLIASAVLSGNRNFEGRVHPLTSANYLASPMLVVAYAICGKVTIDFDTEPIGQVNGKNIMLSEIWPSKDDIQAAICSIDTEMYQSAYGDINSGDKNWDSLDVKKSSMFDWPVGSTYIHCPPFFEGMTLELNTFKPIKNARVLGLFGDSITTDHISPAGKITSESPAGKWLLDHKVTQRLFNSYGSRRGHDEVMVRGTFANIKLINKLASKVGPYTRCTMTKNEGDDFFYNVAMKYKQNNIDSIIFAGKFYGSGSSRDWAAKGVYLQGVRLVIAESFERIHRSNLIGMGVLPCEYVKGNAETYNVTGEEQWTLELSTADQIKPQAIYKLVSDTGITIELKSRIDTTQEVQYYLHGGILRYMIRDLCQ